MNKKIIGIVFCIFFIVNGVIPSLGTNISGVDSNLTKSYSEPVEITYVGGSMWTTGPIFKIIAEIDLISGPSSKIQQIDRILKRPKLRLLPFVLVKISDLEFSVTYKKNLFFLRLLSPSLTYATASLSVQDQHFIVNIAHTVTIKNFDGYFLSMRNLILHPARFIFVGFFDEAVVTDVPSTQSDFSFAI
ncbi:MAG: hypothetical protein JSW60_08790 [Thermoplasmatales archaeon]|nr:MAG: hypothetical protein JSW60_08790 [Thermoplasmatales archaeon]